MTDQSGAHCVDIADAFKREIDTTVRHLNDSLFIIKHRVQAKILCDKQALTSTTLFPCGSFFGLTKSVAPNFLASLNLSKLAALSLLYRCLSRKIINALVIVSVHNKDARGLGHFRALHTAQTNTCLEQSNSIRMADKIHLVTSKAKYSDCISRLDFACVQHSANTSRNSTADQT